MTTLTGAARQRLKRPVFWQTITLDSTGSPFVTPTWADATEEHAVINTGAGWRMHRNVQSDPRIALAMFEPHNPYEFLTIAGAVVDIVEGPTAETHLDQLAQRYTGTRYLWRRGEDRILLLVEPSRIQHETFHDDPYYSSLPKQPPTRP